MDRYIPFRNVECFRHTLQTTNNKFLRRVEQRLEHPYPKNIHENLADNKIPENSAKKHMKNMKNQIFICGKEHLHDRKRGN